MSAFRHFTQFFVRINYASNMVACYDNDADEATAPRVYTTKLGNRSVVSFVVYSLTLLT